MSIHDFYSKLVSGKEEGSLFEALRKLRKIQSPVLTIAEEPIQWSIWNEDPSEPFATATP